MAQITFTGMCKGTETKVSSKTNREYKITSFVDMTTFKTFEVFGDLGLQPDTNPREYKLDATIVTLNDVKVRPSVNDPVPATTVKNKM